MQFTRTNPAARPLEKRTVSNSTEQKLKLVARAEFLQAMIEQSAHDDAARAGFEQDLATLRNIYKSMVPDAVIQARCERLATLRQSLNIRITDNRQAYSRQTDRAVTALCGEQDWGFGGAA